MAEMTRKEVFDAIEGERFYQIEMALSPERPDMVQKLSIGETILAMEKALADARLAWYNHSAAEESAYIMEHLRKVAGLAVQAGENYGMPHREGF